MPPELIAGRYRVEREVGRGGMGSVWLCLDERLGRPVAVKQVGGLPGESSMHLARALREARHSAALNHPHVVAIFDAIEDGDQVWLVMEYVPSRTLDELVRHDGPLEPRLAARVCADVADGLAAAHALGTVHRDVKPSNILVRDDDGRGMIADFGIARTVGQEQLTGSGLVTGTPAYFSPELARGHEPDPASDVWALGITLYVAVEGRSPYDEQVNAIALLNKIAAGPAPVPSRAGPLAGAVKHMLDLDARARWTMAEAARALRRVATGDQPTSVLPVPDLAPAPAPDPAPDPVAEPVADPVATPVRGTRRPADTAPRPVVTGPARRRHGAVVPVLAAVLVVVALAAGGWWLTRDRSDAPGAKPAGAGATNTSHRPSSRASSQDTPRSPTPSGSATSSATGSSTTSESSPATSVPANGDSSAASPPGADAGSPTELVSHYYELLPEDTDAAWTLLTPALQDRIGKGTFEGFWATIDDVRVDDTEEAGDDLVQVTLTYTTSGRQEQETRELVIEPAGDDYLISEDRGAV